MKLCSLLVIAIFPFTSGTTIRGGELQEEKLPTSTNEAPQWRELASGGQLQEAAPVLVHGERQLAEANDNRHSCHHAATSHFELRSEHHATKAIVTATCSKHHFWKHNWSHHWDSMHHHWWDDRWNHKPFHWLVGTDDGDCKEDTVVKCQAAGELVVCILHIAHRFYGNRCNGKKVGAKLHVLCC